jgi:hypothetical protein
MTHQEKKERIKGLIEDMLTDCHANMVKNIDSALMSGAVDVDGWEPDDNPMILPKCVLTAILKRESTQYYGNGTSFQNRIKKEVDNIMLFI